MENKRNETDGREKRGFTSRASGLFFTLGILIFVAASLIISVALSNADPTADWYIFLSYLASPIALLLTLALGAAATKTPVTSLYRRPLPKAKFYLLAAVLIAGTFFGLGWVNDVVAYFFSKLGYTPTAARLQLPTLSAGNFALCVITVAFLPALFEETFFRGAILAGLENLGETAAVVVSAALFSLFHMSPEQTVYQFAAGCLFGLVAVKSRSLLPTVFMHFLNNLAVLVNYYFIGFYPSGRLLVLVSALGLAVLAVGLFFTLKIKSEVRKTEKPKDFIICAVPGAAAALILWVSAFFGG